MPPYLCYIGSSVWEGEEEFPTVDGLWWYNRSSSIFLLCYVLFEVHVYASMSFVSALLTSCRTAVFSKGHLTSNHTRQGVVVSEVEQELAV